MMEESDTYLAILDEGCVIYAKEAILLTGEHHLGVPSESIRRRLQNVIDLERLRRMHKVAFRAARWEEILQTP
jgi:hypothetical protein